MVEVVIDRDDNFRAFWANAYAECGPANTSWDFLASVESTIQLAGSFTASIVGLQIDVCVGAFGVEANAGQNFEVFNGLDLRFTAADVSAVCSQADAALQRAEARTTGLDTQLSDLKSTVDHLESGGAWLNGMAMIAGV
jgi:hypothetical protein